MILHSCYGNLCKITRQDIKHVPQAVYCHISAMEKPLRVFLYLGTLHKGLQGKIGKFVKVLILELNHKQLFYMEDGIQLFSVSQSTTVDDPGHLFNGLSSFPNVLGLALHQWSYKYDGNIARFAYTMKEKITTLQWACSLEETEVRV